LKTSKIKICKNSCIFCFISQLPENLRYTLYIKDDDYIQSFTHGNFITLTNNSNEDIEKIIKYRIEPLNISIHSFDMKIRNKLFGNNKNQKAIDYLSRLDNNKIKTNIQVVLCPGINDGKDLENTLINLTGNFKNMLSIGIVPVGITKYNKNKELRPYDKNKSLRLINFINDFKIEYKNNKNVKKIYLSDEFYILADYKFPEFKEYGRFFQIQNGIGKAVEFIKEINDFLLKNNKKDKYENKTTYLSKNILVITSEYGSIILKNAVEIIKDSYADSGMYFKNRIKLLEIRNNFFGGNVKVTGLLCGIDIISKLQNINLNKYNKIIIPGCIFNDDGLTIDSCTGRDIAIINNKIKIIGENGKSFAKEVIY
jgi:putative radical SAM enzyme (TIGR03279 family)